jgi:acetolactate synthase-1/3 small subunit
MTADTITLEVAGNEEKIEKLVGVLQEHGIREVVRSGSVAIARGP